MAKATTAQLGKRFLVRAGFIFLAFPAALFWGSGGAQLSFVALSVAAWSGLEAAVVYKVKVLSFCKGVPFAIRLLCGYGLDVEMVWLLAPDASGPSPEPEYASLMDGLSNASVSDLRPPTSVKTLSVVLPCANEGDFVKRTIQAVFAATPPDELAEIIVVDDASTPTVDRLVTPEELEAHKAHIIRHENQEGLIRSKKDGGDAAKGDAVVFLDCHVRPMDGWTGPILRNLRENPKRIVVPAITSLNPDTWEEISPYGGGTKMCLTWDADFFWCNEYPGPLVPIMSGGLLAMTKFWWESIGGYDAEMKAWGGENLDQSLRTWLCGGEIRVAEGSRVAHMWRDPSNPKTMLRYRIPTNDVLRNRLRASVAWLDGWADKVKTFPQFEDFREGGPLSIGSLDNIEYYRKKLNCKGFDYYLNKFKDFYIDTGLVPTSVFNLREKHSGLCMSLKLHDGKPGSFNLAPCSAGSELQRFHEANMAKSRKCCSGIKVWNFDSCLQAQYVDGDVGSGGCDHFGYGAGQQMALARDGALEWHHAAGCVVPRAPPSDGPDVKRERAAVLASTNCSASVEKGRVTSSNLCLTAKDGAVHFEHCRGESDQGFSSDGGKLRSSGGLCVQEKDGGPVLGPCESGLSFQSIKGALIVQAEAGTARHLCAAPPSDHKLHLSECADVGGRAKPGQGFLRRRLREDGSFLLTEEQVGLCLRASEEQGHQRYLISDFCPPADGDDFEWRWHYDERGGQLKLLSLGLCLDAYNYRDFLLYTCYAPGENVKQRYLLRDSGLIEVPRSWADNGRLRYPAQCFDVDPQPPTTVTVVDCKTARASGVQWERAWPEEPMEMQLWRKAAARSGFLGKV